jgi:hypothetical protein
MRLFVRKTGSAQHYIKDLRPDAQELVNERFATLTEIVMSGVLEWGFEVIKHLAIFNGGGLAGAAALAQVVEKNSPAHALTLEASHLFVSGLILALVTMVAIYITGLLLMRRFIAETMEISLGTDTLGEMRMSWAARALVVANWILAASSIALFLMGAFKIMAVA